ncbi:MAG: hypothetical protein JO092_04030 [Candidatus Eremiobacteraeota bacterium]|nr:hypothetical protein [Candidatus Eremiobacteraeota bacterium]MBV8374873.1 hypothetical protein [Candidatus Eremiobacteraeota bacterium]
MPFLTLRFDRGMDSTELRELQAAVYALGATIALRSSARIGRTYGLLEIAHAATADAVRAATGAALYDTAIIALAVFPAPAEALPLLLDALGGAGRPSGVLESIQCGDGAVIEWDPRRTRAVVVLALIDVELRRFGASRTAELLSPLPEAIIAQISADGLTAEITSEQIVETLVDRAGL